RMPPVGSDLGVDALLFAAFAVYRVINRDVVFQRIGAGDVIVVFVFATPDHAARLVFLAGDGLELHLDKAVFQARVVLETDGIRGFTGLFQDVGFAGSGIISHNFPSGLACAGLRRGPAGRRRASFEVVEVDGVGKGDADGETAHECKGQEYFHWFWFEVKDWGP